MNNIKKLQDMINESNNIVVLTGAGVSTDSGLKDFRSKDGLYNISDYPAEYMLSNACFYNETEKFYEYYKKFMNTSNVKPNITHKYLKKLEDIGKLKAIITQNIDGLHTKAGSKNVYEVHGTTYINHCIKCNKEYNMDYVFNSDGIPKCECGGIIKPNVTLYGEMLPEKAYNNAVKSVYEADMLMVLGSSLTVYPASGLVNIFKGKYLVIINNDRTQYDSKASLVINDNLSNVFKELEKNI